MGAMQRNERCHQGPDKAAFNGVPLMEEADRLEHHGRAEGQERRLGDRGPCDQSRVRVGELQRGRHFGLLGPTQPRHEEDLRNHQAQPRRAPQRQNAALGTQGERQQVQRTSSATALKTTRPTPSVAASPGANFSNARSAKARTSTANTIRLR